MSWQTACEAFRPVTVAELYYYVVAFTECTVVSAYIVYLGDFVNEI